MSARQGFEGYLVTDPSEFDRIPNYVHFVDPKQEKLSAVVTHHQFKRLAKCSLKGCGQMYYEGYLVRWQSGRVSNIGHRCAARHVGEDVWGEKLNRYQQEVALPHARADVITAKLQVEATRKRLWDLRASAINLSHLRKRLLERFPTLCEYLAKSSSDDFHLIEDAIERREPIVRNGHETGEMRTVYERTTLGKVSGLPFLRDRAPQIFSADGEGLLDRLEVFPVPSSSLQGLLKAKLQFDSLQGDIFRLAQWVMAGQRFFSAESQQAIKRIRSTRFVDREAELYSLAALEEDAPKKMTPQPSGRRRLPRIYRGE